MQPPPVQRVLDEAVTAARLLGEGAPAAYIPELATVDPELTSACVVLLDGTTFEAGDAARHRFTLQSSAKLALLAGLLEERGPEAVFAVVGTEPTGGSAPGSAAPSRSRGPSPR